MMALCLHMQNTENVAIQAEKLRGLKLESGWARELSLLEAENTGLRQQVTE